MSSDFVTLDSGKREGFKTGAVRDQQAGKPRFDLIPVEALTRLAELYARGAVKYGDRNWEKGMPYSRVYASLLRHIYAWAEGEATEDHLAAVAWNAFTLMAYEAWTASGCLPADLADMTPSASPPASKPRPGGSRKTLAEAVQHLCDLSNNKGA